MKKLLLTFSVLFSSLSIAMIDNGIIAPEGKFHSVVKIMLKDELRTGHCTGTLLSPSVVLTAAHCVPRPDQQAKILLRFPYKEVHDSFRMPMDLYEGPLIKRSHISPGAKLFLKMYHQHEGNLSSFMFHVLAKQDLAFLELEEPIEADGDKFSRLSCSSLDKGSEVMIMGYGKKMNSSRNVKEQIDSNIFGILHYGFNSIVPYEKTSPKGLIDLPKETYTIAGVSGQQMINSGDSGGPLFQGKDSSVVFGVVSFKEMDAQGATLNGVFAQTSSMTSKNFYKKLTADPFVSEELKSIISDCLSDEPAEP